MTRPEPLPDQWYSRDFPVLTEAVRLIDERGLIGANNVEIAHALGMTPDRVETSVRALERTGWITRADWDGEGVDVRDVSPQAYLVTGLHPTPEAGADRLIAALERAIATAPEGQRKTRLQQIRDTLLSAGRDLVVDVASGVITGQIGT